MSSGSTEMAPIFGDLLKTSIDTLVATTASTITNVASSITANGGAGASVNGVEINTEKLLTSEEYIDYNITQMYGPKRDPLYVVIPITFIYALIFISGVIGNISTCIVISKNRSMHTATNYYLFSLAVSDFLLLVSGVPQEMYSIWSKYPYVFGEAFCVLRGLAAEAAANATVLTITAFTVERYVAICHPFLSHTMSKLSRAVRLILLVWIISIGLAIPQALQFGVMNDGNVDLCDVKRIIIEHSFELSTFLFFMAPMSLITVLYILIGLKLRSSSLMPRTNGATIQRRPPHANSCRQQNSQGTRRVLKMLVAVVVAFFLCWAPFHAQRLVAIYGSVNEHLTVYVIMTYISGILYYLSTCINPLLYNIMSNKFREAFKETLAQCCHVPERGYDKKRTYRVLSRSQRKRIGLHESTDYSGSSVRDESLYSTSTQKQSFDSVTLPPVNSLNLIQTTTTKNLTQQFSSGGYELSASSTVSALPILLEHVNSQPISKSILLRDIVYKATVIPASNAVSCVGGSGSGSGGGDSIGIGCSSSGVSIPGTYKQNDYYSSSSSLFNNQNSNNNLITSMSHGTSIIVAPTTAMTPAISAASKNMDVIINGLTGSTSLDRINRLDTISTDTIIDACASSQIVSGGGGGGGGNGLSGCSSGVNGVNVTYNKIGDVKISIVNLNVNRIKKTNPITSFFQKLFTWRQNQRNNNIGYYSPPLSNQMTNISKQSHFVIESESVIDDSRYETTSLDDGVVSNSSLKHVVISNSDYVDGVDGIGGGVNGVSSGGTEDELSAYMAELRMREKR